MAGGRAIAAATTTTMTCEHIVGTFRKNATEEVRISLEVWRGRPIVNIRVWWYSTSDNSMRPSKKGLALSTGTLPDLVNVLLRAMKTVSPTWRPAA